MRPFSTIVVVLGISLALAAVAQAQSDTYEAPTLLPLPTSAPLLSTANYDESEPMLTPVDPSFTTSMPVLSPQPGVPGAAVGAAQSSPTSLWGDSACGCSSGCCNTCGPRVFGMLGGLVMGRNRANPFWTTYQTNNNANQLMNTQNAGANWAGGGQVTVGYGFCGCCGPALAFTYWGVGPMTGFAEYTDPTNNLSTPINLNTQTGSVMIGANPASFFFDNSPDQRIWRDDRVNNIELNFIQSQLINSGRFQMAALAGFRYFRFDERLTYGSVAFGHQFGDNGGADEAYLSSRCTNNLFGGQVGAFFNWNWTQRFGVFLLPKVGIFANQMNVRNQLYAGDGTQGFDIYAHKCDISMLGEIDFGFNYAVTQNMRAFIGYRVVGVAGLALSDNQFLPYLADNAGFAQVKQNGSLILHGVMMGVAWGF